MISINLKSEINDLIIYPFSSVSVSFCRTMLCIIAANAVVVSGGVSVCLSVTFVCCVETAEDTAIVAVQCE